ncbi:hypothetical protein V8C34DRAFT_6303 [Trichoderma compactum]
MSKTEVVTTETILLQPPIASIPRRSSDPDLLAPFPEHSVHDAESALPPETTVSTARKWNHPPRNKYRVLSCFFAFLVYGMNDGAPGAMVPLFGEYYHLPHPIVSLIFLGPMVGCVLACFTSNRLHAIAGRRGVALTATGAHVLAYLGLSQHPPFAVIVRLLVLTWFGSGLMNGSRNSWFGGPVQGGTLLGFLHGFWGAGATLSPIVACCAPLLNAVMSSYSCGLLQISRIATKVQNWWIFYCLMTGLTCLACIGTTAKAGWPMISMGYILLSKQLQKLRRKPSPEFFSRLIKSQVRHVF